MAFEWHVRDGVVHSSNFFYRWLKNYQTRRGRIDQNCLRFYLELFYVLPEDIIQLDVSQNFNKLPLKSQSGY